MSIENGEQTMDELAPQEPRKLQAVQFTKEQKDLIKRTIAKDHTDDELALFLNFCRAKRLDPFAREVYSIKRKDKTTIQMGIDGLRARGEDTGLYGGQETHWCGPDGVWTDVWLLKTPPSAARVRIFRKDTPHPFTGIAKWDEYKPVDNDFMWVKMPANQLAKCAEALGLRKAFPKTLGGIYATEEMQGAGPSSLPPMPQRASEKATAPIAPKPPIDVEVVEDNTDPEGPPTQRRMVDMTDAVTMAAKFDAPCKLCAKKIVKGDSMIWIRAGIDKGAYHVPCANG